MLIRIKTFSDCCKPQRHNGEWFDLTARADTMVCSDGVTKIPLGVAMEMPEGWYAVVAPRSSTAGKHGIAMVNGIGIIDSQYCGANDEWQFAAVSIDGKPKIIRAGTRIAQFQLHKSAQPDFVESDLADNEDRGGFGTTGETSMESIESEIDELDNRLDAIMDAAAQQAEERNRAFAQSVEHTCRRDERYLLTYTQCRMLYRIGYTDGHMDIEPSDWTLYLPPQTDAELCYPLGNGQLIYQGRIYTKEPAEMVMDEDFM